MELLTALILGSLILAVLILYPNRWCGGKLKKRCDECGDRMLHEDVDESRCNICIGFYNHNMESDDE